MKQNNGLNENFPFYIKKKLCNACGRCKSELSKYFTQNGDGKYSIINIPADTPDEDENYEIFESLVKYCPTKAIKKNSSFKGNPESEFF
ncbi:ferredoxin [Patescibacteria group bacterium]